MQVLVTGTAGFIGFHLARRLLADGHAVVGLDGLVPYYSLALKWERNRQLAEHPGFRNVDLMLEQADQLDAVMSQAKPEIVIHLAAQAGVRYSLENPTSYISSNVVGTFNLLEACRKHPPRHLLIASTSSAYGANRDIPFHETDTAVHPLTIYAATKISTEMIAHCYAHLWHIPTTLFRFFTVYGSWGRPDMAYWIFTRRILAGQPIELFNHGKVERDFTFIGDLVEAIGRLVDTIPPLPSARDANAGVPGDTLSPVAPFRLVNIGRGSPVALGAFVDAIEAATGRTAIRVPKPLPKGDVERTFASADLLYDLTGYRPTTGIQTGIPEFTGWYRDVGHAFDAP
jgi:UDP-glucuronate 4-epimerase